MSLASGDAPLFNRSVTTPLWPPLTALCSSPSISAPALTSLSLRVVSVAGDGGSHRWASQQVRRLL